MLAFLEVGIGLVSNISIFYARICFCEDCYQNRKIIIHFNTDVILPYDPYLFFDAKHWRKWFLMHPIKK